MEPGSNQWPERQQGAVIVATVGAISQGSFLHDLCNTSARLYFQKGLRHGDWGGGLGQVGEGAWAGGWVGGTFHVPSNVAQPPTCSVLKDHRTIRESLLCVLAQLSHSTLSQTECTFSSLMGCTRTFGFRLPALKDPRRAHVLPPGRLGEGS